jgi:AcrR family transcriptional regulator
MSIATRKERQKEELKGKILEAAKELFITKGYDETSIRNIAERIEYSPTTIYLYYKDKDDIFHALHAEGFSLLNQYFKSLSLVEDPFQRLKAITRAYVNFAVEHPEMYDLMFISRAPMNKIEKEEEEWNEGHRAFGFLVQTIEECQRAGHLQNFNTEVLAFTMWSMVHGVCSLDIRCRDKVISKVHQDNIVQHATQTIIDILERMHHK